MKFIMKFKWIILILIIVIIAGIVIFKSVTKNNNNATNDESDINTIITEPVETYIYSWVVKPKFDYDRITHAGDEFLAYVDKTNDSFPINPQTGEKTNQTLSGHSDLRNIYFYDYEQTIWGHRGETEDVILGDLSEEELPDYFPVQSCRVSGNTLNFRPIKFAVYSSNGFMTSFKFDNIEQTFAGTQIAVCKDDKWGFVSNKGVQMVDFIFDDAISIEDGKAFVKEKNKWGIINIEKE